MIKGIKLKLVLKDEIIHCNLLECARMCVHGTHIMARMQLMFGNPDWRQLTRLI